jgi:hypothetical protein
VPGLYAFRFLKSAMNCASFPAPSTAFDPAIAMRTAMRTDCVDQLEITVVLPSIDMTMNLVH